MKQMSRMLSLFPEDHYLTETLSAPGLLNHQQVSLKVDQAVIWIHRNVKSYYKMNLFLHHCQRLEYWQQTTKMAENGINGNTAFFAWKQPPNYQGIWRNITQKSQRLYKHSAFLWSHNKERIILNYWEIREIMPTMLMSLRSKKGNLSHTKGQLTRHQPAATFPVIDALDTLLRQIFGSIKGLAKWTVKESLVVRC